jgi:hypothetical protein
MAATYLASFFIIYLTCLAATLAAVIAVGDLRTCINNGTVSAGCPCWLAAATPLTPRACIAGRDGVC